MLDDILAPRPARAFPQVDNSKPLPNGHLDLPPVVLGGGVFGYDYNDDSVLSGDIPSQTLRLCLRYGISAFDTSPYYTTSEEVMGKAMKAVSDEFPRESYTIITKAGRYGRTREEGFDYSPERIRKSVERSLELFGTDYIDGCYMHDVEFVAEINEAAQGAGWKVDAEGQIRDEDLAKWGLAKGDEGKITGPGDQKVLDAMKTLFELKKEGKIRAVGFSGFPLPTLLRLARLTAFHLEPLDILQSYCHHTLQNTSLSTFLPLFYSAGVKQVISASPLSMGLLRNAGPQDWHPASLDVKASTTKAIAALKEMGVTLEDVALGFGLTSAKVGGTTEGPDTPTVVGLSNPEEVHETMRVYNSMYKSGLDSRKGRKPGQGLSEQQGKEAMWEEKVAEIFKEEKTVNWTWGSGL